MKRLALIFVVAAAALLTAAAGESASGKSLCVGGPHCFSTLQDALNAAGDGDTVRLGPGAFAGGVTITRSVTIAGVAASASRVVGGGPVVTIGSATSTPTVTLRDVTLTGGLTTANAQAPGCGPDVPRCGPGYADATSLGGGIEAFAGTTVTLERVVVTGNRSTPALRTASVKAVCPGGPCPVSFGDAAGIDDWGTMTLIDSVVSDNRASGIQSNGGGIAVEPDASLSLLRSQVTGNSAAATGAFGRFVSGGGILVAGGGSLAAESSVIDGNASILSSAIPHPYPIQDGGNDQSNSVGGGLYLSDGSTASISNSSLSRNTVSVVNAVGEPFGADAALCACGAVDLTLANTTIDHNVLSVNVLSSADTGPSGPTSVEVDGSAAISNTRVTRNTGVITTPNGDASLLGAVAFFLDGSVTPTITASSISANSSTANAPNGAATVIGGGLDVNGPLVVTASRFHGNSATANGASGYAQGGGIWNGLLFGGPTSPLTLIDSTVASNVLGGSPSVALSGGGIYTVGFPVALKNTVVAHNSPDQCAGC